MSNAFGGVTNIVIIVFFLVLVMGYMAFNIQYTKAFKVKNYALTTLEQYEGKCSETTSACNKKIQAYIKQIGFAQTNVSVNNTSCPTGIGRVKEHKCPNHNYCFCTIELQSNDENRYNNTRKEYYHVITRVDMNIPIINNILDGFNVFEVSGDSKPVSIRG